MSTPRIPVLTYTVNLPKPRTGVTRDGIKFEAVREEWSCAVHELADSSDRWVAIERYGFSEHIEGAPVLMTVFGRWSTTDDMLAAAADVPRYFLRACVDMLAEHGAPNPPRCAECRAHGDAHQLDCGERRRAAA